jgi:stage V sporulation protein B
VSNSAAPRQSPVGSSSAVGAGKGLLFITGAKLWFMVAAYVVQFALPRALGSAASYGIWVLVLALVSPLNNVMVTATIQGVSKFCSEEEGRVPAVTRAALRMQAFLGGGTALAFVALAPLIAWFEHDRSLTPALQLAAGVILAYSFYAVFVGAANGAREFHKQAGLDVGYSTLRASLVVGAAVVFHSALASIGGFVCASVLILGIAYFVVGLGGEPRGAFPARNLWTFFGGVAVYLLIINLLMFVDGVLLKRLVAESAMARGLGEAAAAVAANEQEGYYGAVQNVARIPYQLILAVTFVIFPLVSRATFERDQEKTRGYVRATMRYSLLVCGLLAATLAARPTAVMRLFYKPEYSVGATALAVLLVGYVCFSLFNIAGTIINGAGKTRPTMIIGAVTLMVALGACWGAIALALSTGRDPLLWAALATTGSMAFGLILSGLYLMREFGAFLQPLSIARTGLATAATLAIGRFWPTTGFLGGKVGTLMSCAVGGTAFLVVAVASGELRPAELMRLRRGA